MKKFALLALSALALASCKASHAGADGYTYDGTEFVRNKVTVTVVTYPSTEALEKAARHDGLDFDGLMAWATLSSTKPECTVHIVAPESDYQPEWIGHEFTHCIRGRFHPGNG